MAAVFVGLLFIAFTVFAVVPQDWALQWGTHVLAFIKGALPVITLIIGFMAVLIGIADIRDRREEKRKEGELDQDATDDSVTIDKEEK